MYAKNCYEINLEQNGNFNTLFVRGKYIRERCDTDL